MSQMENEQGPAGEPNHIRSLLDGESGSVEILWKTYFARIRSLISNRIRNSPKLAGYEEDIALSAFGSFVRRAAEGQFPDLRDDDELWKLLKTFAIRKKNDHFKYHMAEKRGGKVWTTQHSAVGEEGENVDSFQPIDPSCSPEASVDVSDLFNFVLSALPNDFCLDIVLLKLQGASIAAIAIELEQLMPLAENDSGSRLYAVVDSCIHPDVPDFVQGLQTNARSLFSGNAGRDFGSVAPYLIAVAPTALEWIVTNLWSKPWGILVFAKADLEEMRRHFRRFLMVGGPRDKELYFRFYDPRVLQSFFDSAPLKMIARFTEPIESLWVVTEDQEIVRLKPPQRIAEETQNLTNGKLRFSEENLGAFALASKSRFRERLIKHLSAKIAEQGQPIGSQRLVEQVDEGISRALHYEIKSQRLIARYIETACLGMGGFTEDRDPIPVRNILLDRRIDISQRLDRFEQFAKNKMLSMASGT